MPSLQESLSLVGKVRSDNPGLDSLNDQELADLVYGKTQDKRLLPAKNSSALARGVNSVGQAFNQMGGGVEHAIADENSSYPVKVVGRTAGNLVRSAPELALGVGAAYLKGVPRLLGYGAGAAFSYGRTKAETGDEKAALGSGASFLASLKGGIAGSEVGRRLAGESAGPITKALAGTAGSAIGSIPGDYIGMVTQPGEDPLLHQFTSDPLNLPSYALGQTAVGAGIDLAAHAAESRMKKVQARKAETPDLADILNQSAADEFARLNQKPLQERTELDLARMRDLGTHLAQVDEKIVAAKMKQAAKVTTAELPGLPEVLSTLKAQIHLLNSGKKAVVEIPKGAEMPDIPVYMQGFKQHDSEVNGNSYLYDERKTTPDQIDNAVKTNNLGQLLGYGIPGLPSAPSGEVAVLRSKRGTEKAAVILDQGSKPSVLKALGEMALGDDVVSVESPQQVASWRVKNKGQLKLFSLSNEFSNPASDISFENHVLDMFHSSLEPKVSGWRSKGSKFTLDPEGKINGKGLLKAVKQWSPSELWAHYQQQGIETLLDSNKVSPGEFRDWIRTNTPEVEVKKLIPQMQTEDGIKWSELQHQLESTTIDDKSTPEQVRNYQEMQHEFDRLSDKLETEPPGDAATGRFGVEPKLLENMPGAVDILVRVPTTGMKHTAETGRAAADNPAEILYRGPHFGSSDKNVLASIRGYEETLPNGKKVFHVFEVQSDWGQLKAKQDQRLADHTLPPIMLENRRIKDHPLLTHYETLALKTAIQHARSIGADYIALSDAQTAMMTERHDQFVHSTVHATPENMAIAEKWSTAGSKNPSSPDFLPLSARIILDSLKKGETNIIAAHSDGLEYLEKLGIKIVRSNPKQAAGMNAAYDERLPAIAKRLTGDKGSRVDFGPGQDRESPIFKNANGTPKDTVTARLFDITNPRPEVKRLFSLYDADAQSSFESTLDLEGKKRDPAELTPKAMLERAIAGDGRVETDSLLNFLKAIKGTRGAIREGTFLSHKVFASFVPETNTIRVNKDVTLKVNEAFSKLSHEFTHSAIAELARTDPQTYEYLTKLVQELGQPARESILTEIKRSVGLGDKYDAAYLSGKSFDVNQPNSADKTTHEFVAGLVEAAAEAHYKSESVPEWYRYLPQPVVAVFRKVANLYRKYFGKDLPSVSAILDPGQAHRLSSIVDVIHRNVIDTQAANLHSSLKIAKTRPFDERSFVDNLPTFRQSMRDTLPRGSDELHSFASDIYNKTIGKVASKYEDFFFSALFRTRTRPETSDFFWALHNMRPNIQSESHGYLQYIGQLPDGSLSRQQALERYGKFMSSLTDPYNKRRNTVLDAYSRVIEENQNRRERLLNPTDGTPRLLEVTPDKLVQKEEMVEKYGLQGEEAEFLDKIIKLPQLVLEENLRKAEAVDTHYLSKLFYRANKGQDLNGVVQRVSRLNRIANDFGAKRFEKDTYQKRLDLENRQANPDLEMQGLLQQHVSQLQMEEDAFKVLMDQSIRQEFGGAIMFKAGPDSFINSASEAMVRMAALRAHQKFITKDAGYAPMTRRGRYLLRVYEKSEFGEEFAKVKEFKGFDSEADAKAYIKDNELSAGDFELLDKEDIRGRAAIFHPDKLKGVRDKAKEQLGQLIESVANSTEEMDPAQRETLLETLSDLERNFQPLEEEIKDVLAVRGDKFKERRWLVPGFDRNDFLPNIFEYMNYKTVAGNKQLTRAIGDLQLERKELESDPHLKSRMEQELNYVLSNQDEFNKTRKAVFYYYLGASFRHIVQNAVQIPLNGVSQMMSNGHGLSSYKHFARAAKLATEYGFKGSTGDKTIDILLKQAEKDGVSFQTALEAPVHESVDLQNALDSINSQNEGTKVFGQKISHVGTKAIKSFEQFMQATSAAAEHANRKTTFIASVLAERTKGVTDPAALYKSASEFTNYVNFVGDKPNRPGYVMKAGGTYLHGPIVLWSALQSFTVNHISQLYSFYEKGIRQGSKADKAALAAGLAHLLAFAGGMGFIGAATAEQLLEQVTGFSLKTAIKRGFVKALPDHAEAMDRIADTVLYGLPSLVGVDASNSIGLGSPFFRYQAGQPVGMEQFGGAAVGMAGRVAGAVGQVAEDPFNPQQWWSATRSAAPAFLSNALRVYDVMNSGTLLDSKQQPIGDPLGIEGSASALAGFTPMQVSKERAFNNEVYKASKRSADDYQRSVLNIGKLIAEYDRTGNQELLLKANDLFSNYVDSTGGTQNRQSMVDSITQQVEEFEGKVTPPASRKTSASRQELEQAYPSVKSRYSSETATLFRSLEVAKSLGQDDLLFGKLNSLPVSLRDSLLSDALVQSGLRPEQVQSFLQPSSEVPLGRARKK